MIRGISIVISFIVVALMISSGCTSTKDNTVVTAQQVNQSANTPIETPTIIPTQVITEPTNASTIWDNQVTQPPDDLAVSISVDKDQIFYTITVTFNGGAGQSLVSKIQVKVTTSKGQNEIKPLRSNKGDTVQFSGTNQNDRVQVAVWYMTGASYLIYDEVIGFQPPMPR